MSGVTVSGGLLKMGVVMRVYRGEWALSWVVIALSGSCC